MCRKGNLRVGLDVAHTRYVYWELLVHQIHGPLLASPSTIRLLRTLARIPNTSQLLHLLLENVCYGLQTQRDQRLDHRQTCLQIDHV